MTTTEFKAAVAKMERYLGPAPLPNTEAIAAWLERMESIPSEAVPYIVRRVTDDMDRWPRNIPKLFRQLHLEWLAADPTPTAPAQQHYCGQCYDGILWLERGNETAVKYCACYRGHPGHVGRSTLAAMSERGWSLVDLTGLGTASRHNTLAAQLHTARIDYSHPDYRRADHHDEGSPFV
jgi:hypothetical protein